MKEIRHAIHKYHSRLFPVQGFLEAVRVELNVGEFALAFYGFAKQGALANVAHHVLPINSRKHALCVTVLATGTYLGVQPVPGFQVVSVHSIFDFPIEDLLLFN